MDFAKLTGTLNDEGEELILYRAGISLNLFYDSPLGEIGASAARIIEDYLAFIAPDAIEKYLAQSGYKKLTRKALTLYLDSLKAAEEGDEFFELHFGPGVEPGPGYSVHFHATGLDEPEVYPDATNLLTLEFPPDILDRKGVQPFIDFLVQCANRHKFHYGIAGYAFQHSVMTLVDEAHEEIAKAAMRYIGFDISYDSIRDDLKGHVHNVSWLNFFGPVLVKKLGGADKFAARLPEGATVTPLKSGLMVQVSPLPPVGDVNRKAPDIAPLKALARIVKPLRIESDYLGSDDDGFAERWLGRLD
jgi:hypothetical protein